MKRKFTQTVEIITAETPRYFMEREKALIHHNFHGGFLWKRKPDVSKSYKPYATGVLPASRLDIYELWQVNGRPPTKLDIFRSCQIQHDRLKNL